MEVNVKTQTKKLSRILMIYSMSILLVLNFITAILTGVLTNSALKKQENDYLSQTLSNAKGRIEDFVTQYTVVTEMLANNPSVKSGLEKSTNKTPLYKQTEFKNIVSVMQETQSHYSDILGMTLGSVGEDAAYIPSGKKMDYRLSERPFYNAVTENRTVITQPYVDAVTNVLCISIVVPIQVNGEAKGLVCLDLKLDQISNLLSNLSFDKTGRVILVSKENIIIGHENTSIIGKNLLDAGFQGKEIEQLSKQETLDKEHLLSYSFEGLKKVGVISEIKEYEWKVLVGVSKKEYNEEAIKNVSILIFLLLLTLVFSTLLLGRVIHRKLKPLSEINDALREMSEGNLQVTMAHTGNDEIGEMATSMRVCIENLSAYVHEIDKIMMNLSEGNLVFELETEFRGDFISIQDSIMKFRDELKRLVTSITDASEHVASSSNQVSSGAQELAQGSTEQAASMDDMTEIVVDISNQIQMNAESAQTVNNQMHMNSEALNECNEQMKYLIQVMEKINTDSNKIQNITKLMNDIAFQTNILALNAAVEAARAGSAGKGFAVVADEVRNLAGKSSEASEEITQLISNSTASIKEGSEASQIATQSLEKVLEEAQVITKMMDQIEVASNQQAEAIKKVDQNIGQIASVVQANSATAEESAAASQELSNQAMMLKEYIRVFKIAEETTQHSARIEEHETFESIPDFDSFDKY